MDYMFPTLETKTQNPFLLSTKFNYQACSSTCILGSKSRKREREFHFSKR